jgi:REP element-mobilizing transposase RayT
MEVLKQRFSHQLRQKRRLISGQAELWPINQEQDSEIWQKRFYDFNVWTEHKRLEKLRYMHYNPVKRGRVTQPDHWTWSSYRSYAFGETGPVQINQWQVHKLKIRRPAA